MSAPPTLAHGDLDERVVADALVVLLANGTYVACRLDTGEEYKEERDRAVALEHRLRYIEGRLIAVDDAPVLGVLRVHFVLHVVFERLVHVIVAKRAQDEQFLEVRLLVDILREDA